MPLELGARPLDTRAPLESWRTGCIQSPAPHQNRQMPQLDLIPATRTALMDVLRRLDALEQSKDPTSQSLDRTLRDLFPQLSSLGKMLESVERGDEVAYGARTKLPTHDGSLRASLDSVRLQIDEFLRDQLRQRDEVRDLATAVRDLRKIVEKALEDLAEEQEEFSLVGRFIWELRQGDSWTVGPESVFKMSGITRRLLVREAYMLEGDSSLLTKLTQVCLTLLRRSATGEPIIFDEYYAERDDALLGISTDRIGSSLCLITVDRPIVARKSVYFASQRGVTMRVSWPTSPNKLKKLIYGVGYIFQRFEAIEGRTDRNIVLHIDGDLELSVLDSGQSVLIDPRHAYAWDETVSHHLVRFGPIWDQLLRGLIPFYTEFRGPGRVWYSTESFDDGFLGYWGTPTAWLRLALDRVVGVVRAVLGVGRQ